ncbi:hypothetical protein TNCV_2318171 [Trichonephila clavipes]|nr:hypothetical protein TNCV_2318171 [Trichonephila clavipes]
MWDALGRQVAGRNYPPTNKNTLIRALTEDWDKLHQQLLDNVVQSMSLDFCLLVHGGYFPRYHPKGIPIEAFPDPPPGDVLSRGYRLPRKKMRIHRPILAALQEIVVQYFRQQISMWIILNRLPEQSSGLMVLFDLVPSWIRHHHHQQVTNS